MRILLAVVALTLGACSSAPPPSDRPPPVVVTPDASAPVAVQVDAAAPATACAADPQHCCLPDGRIVVPGGCEPVHRDGEYADVVRNEDGTCRAIECLVRCLPAGTRIATPGGEIAVEALAAGDPVWTVDASGARVASVVEEVRSTAIPVPGTHALIEIALDDGRVVRASAGHPLADGDLVFGTLAVGAPLDGSTIATVRPVPYDGDRTWDLLPAGATGAYWADGILVGSTLARRDVPGDLVR